MCNQWCKKCVQCSAAQKRKRVFLLLRVTGRPWRSERGNVNFFQLILCVSFRLGSARSLCYTTYIYGKTFEHLVAISKRLILRRERQTKETESLGTQRKLWSMRRVCCCCCCCGELRRHVKFHTLCVVVIGPMRSHFGMFRFFAKKLILMKKWSI